MAFSRFTRHRSQTVVISTLWLVFSCDAIKSRSLPRLPFPMWHNEIRSFAPAILLYERAVLTDAAAPASRAADLVKNAFRSIVLFRSFIPSSYAVPFETRPPTCLG